jgi:hypothetical protein
MFFFNKKKLIVAFKWSFIVNEAVLLSKLWCLHQLSIQFASLGESQAFLKLIIVISIAAKISDIIRME